MNMIIVALSYFKLRHSYAVSGRGLLFEAEPDSPLCGAAGRGRLCSGESQHGSTHQRAAPLGNIRPCVLSPWMRLWPE